MIILLSINIVSWAVLGVVFIQYIRTVKNNRRLLDALGGDTVDESIDLFRKIHFSKKQLEITFDALSDPLCITDRQYRLVRVNTTFARKAGKQLSQCLGEKCYESFFKRSTVCPNCPSVTCFETGKPVGKRIISFSSGEGERYYEVDSFPVFDENGKVQAAVEHFHDITEEKILNENLARSDRLAGIGIMTAGIAHEMNNPLSGLSGIAVNMLKMPKKYGLNEKGLDRVSAILECAARATAIISDLLRFSQKQETVRKVCDMAEIVRKAVGEIKQSSLCRVKVRYDFEDEIPGVRCDPVRIEQVITNILSNSIQAIKEKRKLAEQQAGDFDGKIRICIQSKDNMMTVSVHDNGNGIAPEIETKIFDPFFTTKPSGKGTGLGLSICHRIIEEHQGHMSATTRNGHTTVKFTIPIGKDPFVCPETRIISRRKRGSHV